MTNAGEDLDGSDKVSGRFGVWGLLTRLSIYFKPERGACIAVAVLVILQSLMGRLIVVLFGMAIDRGLIAKNYEFLLWAAGGYLVLELSMMSLQAGIATWFARIGNRVLYRLRDHLVEHVQGLPASYFDRVPSGKIVTRMTADTVSFTELFNQGLLSIFSSLVSIFTIVIAMAFISPKMTLLTLLVAPPLIWIALLLSDRILKAQRETKKFVSTINAFVAESVSGMRVVQLFNQTGAQRARFNSLSGRYRESNMKVVRLYALFHPTVSIFTACSVATALYIGGDLAFGGIVTTGAMVAFIFHVKDFTEPLRNILERYQLFQNSVSSGERIFALLEEKTESSPAQPIHLKTPVRGNLRFDNVSFQYAENLPLALQKVSFNIESGTTLAVVGRTGSGKSTMISLLQRFRDPVSGTIVLDGVDLTHIDRSRVRRTIGVVQQDVFLFRGSIAANIGLEDPLISNSRIEWAAREAGLSRLLKMRPGGFDAIVEERGANLSLGERQLIAFARILAFDPAIMILDEATASVDSETEQLLQAATARARIGRTSIIIAHRLSTIADADRVLVLAQGKVMEFGAPNELIRAGGIFKEMTEAQQIKKEQMRHSGE